MLRNVCYAEVGEIFFGVNSGERAAEWMKVKFVTMSLLKVIPKIIYHLTILSRPAGKPGNTKLERDSQLCM